jgi:hypothetical protein
VQKALDGVFGGFAAGAAVAVDEGQCQSPPGLEKKALLFLEKKEAKKLPLNAGRGRASATTPRTKSFLLLFFKKEALVLCGG